MVKILVRVMEIVWMVFFYRCEQVYEVSLTYYDQLKRYRLCTQNFNQIVEVKKGNNLVKILV